MPTAAVKGHRISTVVPGAVTGADVFSRRLSGADLAAKLHYIRAVYFFSPGDAGRLGIKDLKEPMFPLLTTYYPAAGRIRRRRISSEVGEGRPFVRCNDSGVRIIEAECGEFTVDEWLAAGEVSRHRQLVADDVVGPDLHFSPTVYFQFTKFRCGGLAVGLSWAHFLGDAACAATFISLWGDLLSGKQTPKIQTPRQQQQQHVPDKNSDKAAPPLPPELAVKRVEPVGDKWVTPVSKKMETFSFSVHESKLKQLMSSKNKVGSFEAISALLWRIVATIRVGREPKLVTICRPSSSLFAAGELGNKQVVTTASLEKSPARTKLPDLAEVIAKATFSQTRSIEQLVGEESGNTDFVLYGANLTFVDMEGVEIHALQIKGQKAVHVEFFIDGVGEEGAVMVIRGGDGGGRVVKVVLPEDEIPAVNKLLRDEFSDD